MKVLKAGLSLVILALALAGCATTQEPEVADNTPTTADTDAGSAEGTGVEDTDVLTSTEEEEEVELETVFYFDFDKSELKPEARALLTAHAEQLKADPRSVRLEGHADERGSREYNIALGERRANAVRDFLVLQGVDAGLLETISYGEERPVAFGSNESSWAQNRRVELK